METNLNVKLLRYTPEPLKTVACAAKLCYAKTGAAEIEEGLTDEAAEKFVKMLVKMGHMSPIEHISFTFAIEGVSRALTHQLVRHRLASFSQQSQRYVEEMEFDYIIPEEVKKDEEATKVFIETMDEIQESYIKLRNILADNWEKTLIEQGKEENKAKKDAIKLANEDARFVLPNACETKIIVTMNARELIHFFNHRTCNRAQWEIRNLATQMLFLVRAACPIIFDNVGPNCVTSGKCPEGNMSCGKMEEMKEKFLNK